MRTRIEGKLSIDHWRTQLKAGVENITNYTYLDNASVKYTAKNGDVSYKNDMAVRQHSGKHPGVQRNPEAGLQAGNPSSGQRSDLSENKQCRRAPAAGTRALPQPVHQVCSGKKGAQHRNGVDLRYFTQYYAPDYAPAIGQFYLQNRDTRYKLGAYPMINGYINLHLKRTRIFVQMYNLLQRDGDKSYFYIPHYPLNPRILKIGISWNFFD